MTRILFVCHGNICRSPMAEFVMKDLVRQAGLASQFHIESAATSTEEIGNPVYPPARRKLAEHGIDCTGKMARQLTKTGLRKGFQNGTSKMAQRRCYGYITGPDGELVVNPDEAIVVLWIFEHYLSGDSLGKIVTGLEQKGLPSPTGKPKWSREALSKLLSNEKYTGRVLLQKTVRTGAIQIENDDLMDRYLYTGTHEAIISDELFLAAQQEKLSRAKGPENHIAMKLSF